MYLQYRWSSKSTTPISQPQNPTHSSPRISSTAPKPQTTPVSTWPSPVLTTTPPEWPSTLSATHSTKSGSKVESQKTHSTAISKWWSQEKPPASHACRHSLLLKEMRPISNGKESARPVCPLLWGSQQDSSHKLSSNCCYNLRKFRIISAITPEMSSSPKPSLFPIQSVKMLIVSKIRNSFLKTRMSSF